LFMKLAFSTLGCPGWTWDEIFATATDLGFDGIEVRGIGPDLFAPASPVFSGDIAHTVARLKAAGLEIPLLATDIALAEDPEEKIFGKTKAYIDLAQRLSVKYLRIMSTSKPQPEGDVDLKRLAALYGRICDMAAEKGVSPLIETNGPFADTALLRKFIDGVARPNSGVLWDIHHPFRFCGESPAQSLANLDGLIQYVHVKDSVLQGGRVVYRMMGYGDVPVLDALRALHTGGYTGFASLEWVKRWNPDLEEPGVVFAHFQNYMAYLLRQL
ncbi:MAG: sugar phosphate isomerase/epimerase, partial [Clostridia bacterium]|nr:sugar phosphate isomerase/epimerase [Clostridia bacterium]